MMAASNASAIHDARQSMRYPTNFAGELIVSQKGRAVIITNISRCGALVTAASLPAPGSVVILKARSLEVSATVAWAGRDCVGLRFHRDVEPLEIVRQNADELRLFRTMTAHATLRAGLRSGDA